MWISHFSNISRILLGQSIKILFPESISGQNFSLKGQVVRIAAADTEDSNAHAISVRFASPSVTQKERLASAIAAFQHGPATVERPHEEPLSTPSPSHVGSLPSEGGGPAVALAPVLADGAPPERRDVDRREYSRRVIALGEEATRILIGRDLSEGGIRVEPVPGLSVGSEVRLALHIQENGDPMVVDARVERDD